MRSNLLIQHKFVESTVDRFLEDFKKTIEFAKITDPTDPEEQKKPVEKP